MGWVRCVGTTILNGGTTPPASTGSNGQIYLQYIDTSDIDVRESISNSAVGAYFDTGYYYNENTRIEMKINLLGGSNYPTPIGSRYNTSGTDNKQLFIATAGTRIYYAFGSTEVYKDNFFSRNSDVIFKTGGRVLSREQGGTKNEVVTNTYGANAVASLYLFAANLNGTPWSDSYCIMTFYYCKIFEGNNLVHYYLPVVDGNNVPCLYDCITGNYIYNSGTGTLTVGNAITAEENIVNAYAKVSGSWQDLIGTDINDISLL